MTTKTNKQKNSTKAEQKEAVGLMGWLGAISDFNLLTKEQNNIAKIIFMINYHFFNDAKIKMKLYNKHRLHLIKKTKTDERAIFINTKGEFSGAYSKPIIQQFVE